MHQPNAPANLSLTDSHGFSLAQTLYLDVMPLTADAFRRHGLLLKAAVGHGLKRRP